MAGPTLIERFGFNAHRLVRDHPPVMESANKRAVYDVACPPVCMHDGEIGYSRWRLTTLPSHVDAHAAPSLVEARHDMYDYVPVPDLSGAVEWHVNFADPLLFTAYGSGLFAQDELMVAEHPALASLVEALHAGAHRAVTEEAGVPTPVLVTGVERRCVVATDPDAGAGRSKGLYGRAFAAANPRQVRQATRRVEPPTTSNIIAMAAPRGAGRYSRDQIERIVATAYTGFAAAVAESATMAGTADVPVVIHTGYWGCGAFGGNRVLMSWLQVLAAQMAGVTRLVFHTVTAEGAAPLDEALAAMAKTYTERVAIPSSEALLRVIGRGYEWGTGDGS
jgi:hypothetical protein